MVSRLTKKEHNMERYPLKEIKELLNAVARESILDDYFSKYIGNYTQMLVIKHLIDAGDREVFQKELEAVLNARKSTVSGILDTMEKNRIIVRVSSKTDGRSKVVKLSESAKRYKKDIFNLMESIDKRLIFGISEEDLKTFYRVIETMKENITKR